MANLGKPFEANGPVVHGPPLYTEGVASPAVTGFTSLFALLALAILEHLSIMTPLQDEALWRWALPAGAVKSVYTLSR